MRAGSLSDARVVASLREFFVPCHSSALNTPSFLAPEDRQLLESYDATHERPFHGGEREAFILPDGTMQRVFLSLHGKDQRNGCTQMTAAGRRSEDAVVQWKRHADIALRSPSGVLPSAYVAIWAERSTSPLLRAAAELAPSWPQPEPGQTAFRVFVRNSYRQYDDLLGTELASLPAGFGSALASALRRVGDRHELDREVLVAVGRAAVPRGQVGTHLAPESITGSIALVVEAVAGDRILGRVEGELELAPKERSEVGLRDNAVTMFRHASKLRGRFALVATQCTELRFVAHDVAFSWLTGMPRATWEFEPRHAFAVELLRSAPN